MFIIIFLKNIIIFLLTICKITQNKRFHMLLDQREAVLMDLLRVRLT